MKTGQEKFLLPRPPEEGQLCDPTNLCGADAYVNAILNCCTCASKRRAKHKTTIISKLVRTVEFRKSIKRTKWVPTKCTDLQSE
jgi:hypothetical protein